MYTSGTTGKPKGILHTTGGYLAGVAYTHWAVFDLKPETDVYWTAADIGWVTGHSYIVYGPLANGATSGDVRGHAGHPAPGPLVGDHPEVPGHDPLLRADRDPHVHEVGRRHPGEVRPVQSLRVLGLGRRADQPRGLDLVPAAHRRRPHPGRRHLVADRDRLHHDLPAAGRDRGQARRGDDGRCPASSADVVDDDGKPVPNGGGGYLVLTEPWPAMLRTIWGDDQRYMDTYWSRFHGRATSPATARRRTRTATSGCSAGSTT